MLGAEEAFGRYNPSASNDKVLSMLQRFRDDDLNRLRQTGDMQIAAEREKLANFAAIPDRISQGYSEGTEENRRERQAGVMERQQKLAEEQGARQKELHPFDIESRKSSIERDKFGLSEEQRLSGDAQRGRDWLTAKRPNSEMTNEQYNFDLQQKAQEAAIAAQRQSGVMAGAQMGLVKDQRQEIADNRALRDAQSQYLAAFQSGDPQSVENLDRNLTATMSPGLIQTAKLGAQNTIKQGTESANLFWASSDSGKKTQADLADLRQKADTLGQIKTNYAAYNAAGWGTDKANTHKANLIALLSRPEMGVEGQNAVEMIKSGVPGLGARIDRTKSGFFSSTGERIDDALKSIENTVKAQINQVKLQNSHVKVPAFQQNLQSTEQALNNAMTMPTRKPAITMQQAQPMNTLQPNAQAGQRMQPVNNQNPMQSPALPAASGFRDRLMRGGN